MYESSKAHHPAKLEVIKEISRFRTSVSPVITKENRKTLQSKLAIQKQSTAATSERIINNNLYLNYNRNPFSSLKDKKHKFSNSLSFSSVQINSLSKNNKRGRKVSQIQDRNIIDQMHSRNNQLDKQASKKVNRFQKINKILTESQKVSNKIMSQVQKQKKVVRQVKQPQKIKIRRTNTFGLSDQDKQKIENMELEQILGIKEQNYFFHEGRKPINIFRCPNNDQQNLNAFQRLQLHYFSFKAVIQKISPIKIPIFRDISRLSRQLLMKAIVDPREIIELLDSSQVSYKQSNLIFIDILSFSSARMQPDFLSRINNEFSMRGQNTEGSDASSQIEEDLQIPYRKTDRNFGTLHEAENEEKHEVNDFNHIKLTPQQQRYLQQCKQLKHRVGELIDQKQYMLSNRIQDKKISKTHQDKIQRTFKAYLHKDVDQKQDISKLVRKQKKFKDRKQTFKLNNFISALQQKNEKDRLFIQGSKQWDQKQR